MVLPATQNLQGPFAPTANEPWLTVGNTAGGVVSFNFTENTNRLPRVAFIKVLGQDVGVYQSGVLYPPEISSISRSNGVFQLSFTNGTPGTTYSVLFSTNVSAPLTNWTVLGTVVQLNPNLWQFSDTQATNDRGFYTIRSQ
jgi:hypothetical protein